MPGSSSGLERRFERLIWRFRLISVIPVLLSLLGSVGCFIVGAGEILSAFSELLTESAQKSDLFEYCIARIVGGVDYFVIGIALLIFGYGIYELVISDLDPRHDGGKQEQHRNLLSVGSLESLKHNLTNVIVVALIVSAFKKMIGFPITTNTDLLVLCGCVVMLALSAWLIVRSHAETSRPNRNFNASHQQRARRRTRRQMRRS